MTTPVGKPTLHDLAFAFFKLAIGGSWPNDIYAAFPTSLAGISGGGGGVFDSNSLGANGRTTVDHTAGMVVASLAAPPAGLYKIFLQVASAGGTITNNDMVNYEFRVGATPILRPLAMLADSVGILEAQYRFSGAVGCSVNCAGAGSAGARVAASITLTKIAD